MAKHYYPKQLQQWWRQVAGRAVGMGLVLACWCPQVAWAQHKPSRLDALHEKAEAFLEEGQYQPAGAAAQQALVLARQTVGTHHPSYARAASNLADVKEATGNYAEAEVLYKKALQVRKETVGVHHPEYALALDYLATHYRTVGRYADAERLFKQALAVYKRRYGSQHPEYAGTLNNLAALYESAGRYPETEALLQQAAAIYKRAKMGPEYVTCLNNLAAVYESMGRFAEAEPAYQAALAFRKQELGVQHPDYVTSVNNLAYLYTNMGRYAEAEPLQQEVVALRKQQQGAQSPVYAMALDNLGVLYRSMGRYEEAEPMLTQALAITKARLGAQHPQYATVLNDLGVLHQVAGRYTQAEPLFREAMAIKRQQLGEQHPQYAVSVSSLAGVYAAMGRYADAEPLFQSALAIRKAQLGEQHPLYAKSLKDLAGLYALTGRLALAEQTSAQGIDIVLAHLRSTFAGLSERERQQFLATVFSSTEQYHTLLAQLAAQSPAPAATARAYNHVLQTKGLLLQATAALERQVKASGDTALLRTFARWQATKRQLATARSLPLKQQQERGLLPAALDAQANELEKALASRAGVFGRGLGLPTATWHQVQQALQPGEAAVELVRYRWFRRGFTDSICYSAYVVVPGSPAPQLVVLRNGNALEQEGLRSYAALTHAPTLSGRGTLGALPVVPGASAQALYTAFWQPVAAALPPGTRTVYLSADGAYQQLNLATLQNPATGCDALEETDFRLLGSTRDLVAATTPAATSLAETVLVGAPTYRVPAAPVALAAAGSAAAVSPARSAYTRSEQWLPATEVPPLPGTAQELAGLDTLLALAHWPHRQLSGTGATEEAVRDVHRPRVLHIATHGFFLPAARRPAGLDKPSPAELAAATDPMLRAGLLLAGVSNFRDATDKPATEDGILTAYEASLLDLQGTELVVLSACETGLGQVQAGEGVYGLQRGFTVAGARSILMSLWKVDDAVTRELMVGFYKNWLGGNSKRAALLAAQQQVRRRHPEPYYWGGFVLVGE